MDVSRFDSRLRALLGAARIGAGRRGHRRIEPEHLLVAALEGAGELTEICARLGLAPSDLRARAEALVEALPPLLEGDLEAGEALLHLFEQAAREALRLSASTISERHVWMALAQDPRARSGELLRRVGLSRGRIAPPPVGSTPVLDRFTRDLTALARAGLLDPVVGRDAELRRVVQVLGRRTKNNPVLIGEPGVGKSAIVEALATCIAAGSAPRHLHGRRLLQLDLGQLIAGARYRGDFEERVQSILAELLPRRDELLLFIDEIHLLARAGAGEGGIDAGNLLKPPLARGELHCLGATTVAEYRRHIEPDAALERRLSPIVVEEPDEERTFAMLRALGGRYEQHHGVQLSDEALRAAGRLTRRYLPSRALPDKAIDALDEAASRLRLDLDSGAEPARSLAPPSLRADDVARVVGEWCGVAVAQLVADERERLRDLEERLRRRVVGQDHAVARVAAAIRRARVGVGDRRRPVGSFLFAGPTGVGKTELARALAAELFDDERALVRLDMSEYAERHAAARMIGAPPGYLGHDHGGQLTEALRRRPFAVVLFDEFDKAHPQVHHHLLQILDDGRLTDGQGRSVSFRNAVVVLTVNCDGDANPGATSAALRARFPDELLGRLDERLLFHRLEAAEIERIAALGLARVVANAGELGIHLTVERAAVVKIAAAGIDPRSGARALRRIIQRWVEDPLADRLVAGELAGGETLVLKVIEGRVELVAREEAEGGGKKKVAVWTQPKEGGASTNSVQTATGEEDERTRKIAQGFFCE